MSVTTSGSKELTGGLTKQTITADGGNSTPVDVNIVNFSSTESVVPTYSEISSIPSGSFELIVSYTVPSDKMAKLQRCAMSGSNIADYKILFNGSTIDYLRTYFSGPLNAESVFYTASGDGFLMNAGDKVEVYVRHIRPYVGDFNARIQVRESTI